MRGQCIMKMTTRDTSDVILKYEGYIKSTKYCKGPELSTNRGGDFPCCCTCDSLRTCSRKTDDYFSSTSHKYEIYINLLKKKCPSVDIDTSYAMSTCGKKFFIRKIANKFPEPEPGSYVYCLLDQFIVLKQMGFKFSNGISLSDVSYTKLGIPIYYPNFSGENLTEDTDVIIEAKGKKYLKYDERKNSFFNVFFSFIDLLTREKNHTIIDGHRHYQIPHVEFDSPIHIQDNANDIVQKVPGKPDDKYVILDLDKTLILSSTLNLASEIPGERDDAFLIEATKNYFDTKIRRHLRKFLNDLVSNGYKIIVWSAGIENYVKIIVSVLFKDIDYVYIFTRNHIDINEKKWLHLIRNNIENFDVNNCRLVDDNDIHEKDQEKFFVRIPEFDGDDDVLENFIDVVNESFGRS